MIFFRNVHPKALPEIPRVGLFRMEVGVHTQSSRLYHNNKRRSRLTRKGHYHSRNKSSSFELHNLKLGLC